MPEPSDPPTTAVFAAYCEATRQLLGFEFRIGGKGIYLHPNDARELYEQLGTLIRNADEEVR